MIADEKDFGVHHRTDPVQSNQQLYCLCNRSVPTVWLFAAMQLMLSCSKRMVRSSQLAELRSTRKGYEPTCKGRLMCRN